MSDSEQLAKVKAILTRKHTDDTCACERCSKTITESGRQKCDTCGYNGYFLALACGCYDSGCAGSGHNGAGCPHGSLTCPCCNEGEVDPWEIIKKLREAFDV